MPFPPLRPKLLPSRATRWQVCPPAPRRALPAWWPLWLVAARRALLDGDARGIDRLAEPRNDFQVAIADLQGDAARELRMRVRCAHSLHELWHLRAALFEQISMQRTQADADARVARLNRHFPTRAPLSGFAPLHGAAR